MAKAQTSEDGSRPDIEAALKKIAAETGALPSERRLSHRLNVNRYAIRQAIRRLRRDGVLPPAQSSPALWRHDRMVSLTSPPALWEARLAFEPQLARQAALHGTPRELADIADLHRQSIPDVFDRSLDIAFHRAIAIASHNTLAAFLVDRLTEITLDPAFLGQQPPYTAETGFHHHATLVAAFNAREAKAAERVMSEHLHAIAIWSRGLSTMRVV